MSVEEPEIPKPQVLACGFEKIWEIAAGISMQFHRDRLDLGVVLEHRLTIFTALT
jgi:hypothetical protein